MSRLSAPGGAVIALVLFAGCSSDQAATELAETNAKLSATTKERDAIKERLAKAESANMTAATQTAGLSKQLSEVQAQLAGARVEAKQQEQTAAAAQEARRLAESQVRNEHDAAEDKNRALLAVNRELKGRITKAATEKPVEHQNLHGNDTTEQPIPKMLRDAWRFRNDWNMPNLYFQRLEMGAIGEIQDSAGVKVNRILGKDKLLVWNFVPTDSERPGHIGATFILSGIATSKYATGQLIEEFAKYAEVQGTEVVDGDTFFIVAPLNSSEINRKLTDYWKRLKAK